MPEHLTCTLGGELPLPPKVTRTQFVKERSLPPQSQLKPKSTTTNDLKEWQRSLYCKRCGAEIRIFGFDVSLCGNTLRSCGWISSSEVVKTPSIPGGAA